MSGIRVALPARVEAYDAGRQCVDAQVLVADVFEADGERVAERPPICTDVPVQFPGSGASRITWPIQRGDLVLLVFSSSSTSEWKLLGGEQVPDDTRRHHLNDAVAIPGLHDLAHLPTSAPTDALVLHSPFPVRLGGPGAEGAVVVQAALDAFMAALTTAVAGAGTAASALTSLRTALNSLNGGLGWLAGTQKVKAE